MREGGWNMSVFSRSYRAYSGRTTALWTRTFVLARYGLAEIWASKITVGLFTLSLLPAVVNLVLIYLANNPLARMLVMRQNLGFAINESFFLKVLELQAWLALAVNAWIAPRLISFDLADNALPILLSHPITRFDYLAGKFLALFASLSCVTWIPMLVLFLYQGYSSPQAWIAEHAMLGFGLFIGAVIWIVLLSLLGLALSSWVKWRVVATGAIFGAVFVPAGIGGIITAILRTRWGFLLNIPVIMSELWQRLLGAPPVTSERLSLPTSAIVAMITAASLSCVAILNARIRAREIVRG